MFKGANPLNLDPKGRMAMPTKYRDQIMQSCEGKLVVTIAQDKCLNIYPLPKWREIEQQFDEADSSNDAVVALKRLIIGYADEVDMDSQGRILLPQVLREWAGLERKVVLVGQISKFELWNDQAWSDHTQKTIDDKREGRLQLPPDFKVAM